MKKRVRWCAMCSKDISQKTARAIYCSEKCAGRAWREANPEYNREWREANPEYNREWRAANPEYNREHNRAWHEANPEYNRKWLEANPEYAREYNQRMNALKKDCRDYLRKLGIPIDPTKIQDRYASKQDAKRALELAVVREVLAMRKATRT